MVDFKNSFHADAVKEIMPSRRPDRVRAGKRHFRPNNEHRPIQRRYKGKKKVKRRRGMKALQEIKKYQSSIEKLIPKLPFSRLVKGVCVQMQRGRKEYRWQRNAIEALHYAAEAYVVQVLEDAYLCTLHAKRVTLMARDVQLARRIRGLRR